MFDFRSRLEALFLPSRAAFLLGTTVLLVGACDQVASPPNEGTSVYSGPSANGTVPDSTVRLVRTGPNNSLLSPDADQRLPPDEAVEISQSERKSTGKQPSVPDEVASPYGCVMSTPNLQGEAAYRYESVYAIFPKRIVEAAAGKIQEVAFQIDSRTAYATGRRETAHILRQARCRIPDTEAAERVVRKRLEQFPSPHSLTKSESSKGVVWSGTRSKMCDSQRNGTQGKDLQCVDWTATFDCYTDCDDPNPPQNPPPDECNTTCVKSWECSQTVYVAEDPLDGGACYTGCGDDPSGCNADGGATGQLCESGGGAVEPEADTIRSPCRTADNPPDYCDEAGSCFGKDFENELDGAIIRALEEKGALKELWKKSNADAADQSKREERGGWIVSTDGGYKLVEFHEAESDIVYTPIGIRGIDTDNRPSGTRASFHTHPFTPNEPITDTTVVRQMLEADDEYDPSDYDLSRLAEAGAIDYPSEPSENDFASSENFQGYLIDGGKVYSYDGVKKIEGAVDRCGY